ncbi:hypothetical protein F441_20731 [Phytophthora nicotianae CJ01A1]|uniref:Uncharacterized protein n=1 Tax=Phytophthora nicotianae CJ01A1 TaxID=1317063 RepID=W2VXU2_PHYNI|nr:hypothetical protein F441_20731 [Phytophthora nicotianae CJ01A1]
MELLSAQQKREFCAQIEELLRPLRRRPKPDRKRQSTATRKKKRQRSNLCSSTRLQLRKKAEFLYLRRHVQELEGYLEQLKAQGAQMRTSPICQSAKENTAYWFTLAGINYQARLQSEETNRASKAIMATHVQLNDTLREVVQIQTSYQVR